MTKSTFPWPKFICEIANNHLGSVEEGKKIIDGCFGAVKFQYRDLSILSDTESDYHDRFRETHLTDSERFELVSYVRERGLVPVVTPFDELSVEMCVRHEIPIIKVASCSNDDWPLLEAITDTHLPVIASTGGLDWAGIDRLYSFLKHRNVDFALMHCVAIYPTPLHKVNLGIIREMKERYDVPIGYSGHEGKMKVGPLAIAAGAEILERHVTNSYENAYSLNVKEVSVWKMECQDAIVALGTEITQDEEQGSLDKFRRGEDGKLPTVREPQAENTRDIIHQYEAMFRKAKIPLTGEAELSHHYGIENLKETGAYILTVVNREYAKKLIALLGNQSHPEHYHEKKDETFQVLLGQLNLITEDDDKYYYPGDIIHIPAGAKHAFRAGIGHGTGCIFEEISTHAERGDSYYTDPVIQKMDPMDRKSVLDAE